VAAVAENSLSISIRNDLLEVPRLAQRIEEFCLSHSIPSRTVFKFNLALDEALTNSISYGFRGGAVHEINVKVEYRDGSLIATVSDDGEAFDPLERPAVDVHAPVEERRAGGLGIHLLRTLMDEVAYRRADGRNYLTMRKRVEPG
jgi:serine/threonine-protein kinase RsbW